MASELDKLRVRQQVIRRSAPKGGVVCWSCRCDESVVDGLSRLQGEPGWLCDTCRVSLNEALRDD